MKETVKVVELDRTEQGVMYTALSDLHNKRLAEGKPTDSVDELLEELYSAPTRKVKVKSGEAR